MKKIEVLGLDGIGQIKRSDDLPQIIFDCAERQIEGMQDKDIVVLTSKIVSKAAGQVRKLGDVKPCRKALKISEKTGKDAKWLQMIFEQGQKILAIIPLKGVLKQHIANASEDKDCMKEVCENEKAVCITVGKSGPIHTCDAGIDGSNHPAGEVGLLPDDPDQAARQIRLQLQRLSGKEVAVILADTEMIPFGTVDMPVGSSGIQPRAKMFARPDLFGKLKFGGMDLIAHGLTAASALIFGQTDAGMPVVIIRGYDYQASETENISNTIWKRSDTAELRSTIKQIMRATAYTKNLKEKLLLKIASWFI